MKTVIDLIKERRFLDAAKSKMIWKNFPSRNLSGKRLPIFILISSLALSTLVFVMAELGGYGISGPATSPNSLDYGLVGYWNFEEAGGQTVTDKSGNGNNATLGTDSSVGTDDPVFAPGHDSTGINGTGIVSDGIDDFVNGGDGASINVTGAFTIAGWIKPSVSDGNIFRKVDTNSGYMLYIGSNQTLVLGSNEYLGILTTDNNAISLNNWNYVAATVTSGGAANIYVNGVLVKSGDVQALNTTTANPATIGGASWTTGNFFKGSLDEVRIYNRDLSADEVRLLYNGKSPVLEYHFDEGSGTTIHDESFNNFDSTINGGATWTTGKSGAALLFDGTWNGVSGTPQINADEITVSLFMKDLGTTIDWSIYANLILDVNNRISMSANDDNTRFAPIVRIAGVNYDAPSVAIPAGFNYYTAVFSKSGNFRKTYLNGVLVNTYTGYPGGFISSSLTIGYDTISVIDELRIYNYARTEDEVLVDYNNGMAAHLGKNNQDLNYGLVGYWDMEEAGGQTIHDKSGNGNNGTLGASTSIGKDDPVFGVGHDAMGINGTGLVFNGANDYVTMGSGNNLNFNHDFTVSLWVKSERLGDPLSNCSDKRVVIFQKGMDNIAEIEMNINSSGAVSLYMNNNGSTAALDSLTCTVAGSWYHIAVQYTYSSASASLYINGKYDNTATLVQIGTTSDAFKLSGGSTNCSNGQHQGSMDEIRVYNRTLSADEVRYLYNQKKPVVHLKMDEGSGLYARDESFNNNDGTLGGDGAGTDIPSWVSGKYGSALSFDGSDDYVFGGTDSSVNLTKALTMEAWVKPDSRDFATTFAGLINAIGGNGDNSATWVNYELQITNATRITFVKRNTSETLNFYDFDTSGSLLDNWHHIAAVYDGTNISVILDGQSLGSEEVSGGLESANNIGLMVGRYNNQSPTNFDGIIDDFRLYNYARSAGEVLADYNDGQAGHLGKNNQSVNSGLVGYWDMEEAGGQTIADKSGNGNNATLGVSASVGTDDPVFAPGVSFGAPKGTGLQFDGINDYATVSHSGSLDTPTAFTYSAWVKFNNLDYSGSAGTLQGLSAKGYPDDPASNYGWWISYDNRSNGASFGYTCFGNSAGGYVGGGNNFSGYNYTFTNNIWNHIAVTVASSQARLYINGQQLGAAKMLNNLQLSDSSQALRIGSLPSSYRLNGSIDNVRVYNRALSADEIRYLYNMKKPILEYKFYEGSGTVVHDESFNNNDLTLMNTPAWITGKFGTALSLTRTSSQYGYMASNANIFLAGDLTMSVWIKPSAVTASTLFDIGGKWDGTTESYLLTQYGDEIRLYIDSSSAYKTTDAANLTAGNWYHVEAVYTAASQTVDIYVNGALQASTATGTIPTSIGKDAGRFQIGAEDSTTTAANFYDGIIDSFRLYSYSRTVDEVLTDYNDGQAAHLR